jgi:hypothetical protein
MAEVERQRSQDRYADIAFVVMAVGCGAVLLFLGRSLTFRQDEWRSVTFDGGLLDFLRPVNQHWSTFPLLLYRATFEVVGLHSYLPYLAQVVVLHLLAVGAAYALMRRRVGAPVALVCAVPLLVLGSGAENLFWAFQTGFVGSVVFGLWALFFIEQTGRRAAPVVASVLLLASLASSGMGLFFLAVVAGRTVLDSQLRLRALAVVPPFAAYMLWFALVGSDQVGDGSVVGELSTVRFAIRGVVHATGAFSGIGRLPDGHLWGLFAFLGLALLVVLRVVRGRPPALAAGCLLGVAEMYVVIAFVRVRADPGYDHAISSRYVYVAAFLLVLAVVDLLPERGEWALRESRLKAAVPAALVLLLAWSTASNVDALRTKRSEFRHAANVTRAFVGLALTRGNEPWVDRHVPRGWMPSIAELQRTVARHGSPLEDTLFPGVVEAPGAADEEEALLALAGNAFRVEGAHGGRQFASLEVEASSSEVSKVGRCVRSRLRPEGALWILGLPARARVRVVSSTRLAGRFFLAHEGGPSRVAYADLEPGIASDVVIPDVDDGRAWTLGMDSSSSPGPVEVCVVLADGEPVFPTPTVTVLRWES